jgi:signal transduction histidine kinase
MAVFPYNFVIVFLELPSEQKIVNIIYAIDLILAPLFLFTDYFLSGVNQYFYGYYGKAGPLYIYYIILFYIILIRTFFLLYKKMYDANYAVEKRNQTKYIFISFLLASVASVDYLPKFGIAIYPFGCFFILIWFFITTYAILKHQLMDINIVIRKGLVYSILVAVITAIYFIFVMTIGNLFQELVGYQSFVLNLLAIFAIALLFNPLRDRIQHFLDKRFFKGTLESLAQDKERLKQELFQAEKFAYMGRLASSVVHEIKNPLTAIKTFAEYLPQRYNEPDFKDKVLKILPKEIKRIEGVVEQLLDLARPRDVKLCQINIINTIDSTLTLLENNFKLKNIKVKKQYQPGEILINGDDEQLKQVFLNLFLNSIQAMDEGGTLDISVNLQSSDASRSVLICIKDNGCGIPEENLGKLFTPFFTTKKEGVGLGLVIAQEIIKQHKGNIRVESKLGDGTRFVIELPVNSKL